MSWYFGKILAEVDAEDNPPDSMPGHPTTTSGG